MKETLNHHIIVLLLLLVGSYSHCSYGEIYKWVDEKGKVHYSDKPPNPSENKPEEVNLVSSPEDQFDNSHWEFPVVKKMTPFKNTGFNEVKSVFLEHLSFNIKPEKKGQQITIGRAYRYSRKAERALYRLYRQNKTLTSGLSCKPDGKLNLDNAKYIVGRSELQKHQTHLQEVFDKNGYSAVSVNDRKFALQKQSKVDLSLAAEIVDVKISYCGREGDKGLSGFTQNSTYMKIKWEVFDNLSRKVVFSTESEGLDDFINKPPRRGGSVISADLAFRQATEHLLAQQAFVDLLSLSSSSKTKRKTSPTESINIVYGHENTRFIHKTTEIQQAAVTIRTVNGHGSGFIISSKGHVVTNHHVVDDSRDLLVIIGKKEYPASVLRSDRRRDVALLQINQKINFKPLTIEPDKVKLGEEIYVVGTPIDEELDFSITRGIISAKRKLNYQNFYQTDAAINPGNSGGPVFNRFGNVIGITVAGLFTKEGASMNINYVIPIHDALDILKIK